MAVQANRQNSTTKGDFMKFFGVCLFIIGVLSKIPPIVALGILVFVVGHIIKKVDRRTHDNS